jgi:hypothetical protein
MLSGIPHLPSRAVLLAMFVGLGFWQMLEAPSGLASVVQGSGFVCLGALAFLQPVVLTRSPSYSFAHQAQLAIGPRSVRTALTVAALGALLAGLVLRLASSVV